MAIQILPPQLANQIAAGEVVERPASVVKELVENSIDAGATRIDIEIDKGGSKLIRIKDNGAGIAKAELALALSRHATSKVHSLDDLEAIMSFGFRGEALASISSVSRLTLTSKTITQNEAWQAYAEGSEMAVKVIPAAHPVGTTIDVVDLFFNTPARRRFLKSDKTEFTHIDDWLKRIALVQPKLHFTLSHNGKIVKNYRASNTQTQYLQRLGQVCGRAFSDNALKVECQHNGMQLKGFLQSPNIHLANGDVHYFYVNGRLVRDRLVNHAVRQAFSEFEEKDLPSYVLMLNIDPHQVDVNVHPAKHEVRFHQSRYVHDYILQALQSALTQLYELAVSDNNNHEVTDKYLNSGIDIDAKTVDDNTQASFASVNYGNEPSSAILETTENTTVKAKTAEYNLGGEKHQDRNESRFAGQRVNDYSSAKRMNSRGNILTKKAIEGYDFLMQTPTNSTDYSIRETVNAHSVSENKQTEPKLLDSRFWVLVEQQNVLLLPVKVAAKVLAKHDIVRQLKNGLIAQPLLMPVSIKADQNWNDVLNQREVLLRKVGIELTIRYGQLIIKKVPPYLRESQLASVIPNFLRWIEAEEPIDLSLAAWISEQMIQSQTPSKIWQLLQSENDEVRQEIYAKGFTLPWQTWVKEHFSDQ